MTQDVSRLDFQRPPPGHKFKAPLEPDEAPADRYVRLFKDVVVFLLAVGFVLTILVRPLRKPDAAKA